MSFIYTEHLCYGFIYFLQATDTVLSKHSASLYIILLVCSYMCCIFLLHIKQLAAAFQSGSVGMWLLFGSMSAPQNGSVDMRLFHGSMSAPFKWECCHAASLWVNVSSSKYGSVDIRLFHESMSAPQVGVLTCGSVKGQCQHP